MVKRTIHFPEKDRALRDDVNALGTLVGEVLVEQCGDALFRRVEAVRLAAIARRESGSSDLGPLAEEIEGADAAGCLQLVRGFSSYFQVANLAERVHRIRRIRDYQNDGERIPGSLDSVLARLAEHGVDARELETLLERLVIEPVMTAHPTEATRRTLLEKERAIVRRLVERLNPGRTPVEERMALERIRQQITTGWQTRSYSAAKTTVAAEREHVLFYLAEILYEIAPVFYESLRRALDEHFPGSFAASDLPRILRFGSWVGGDMDGNPNVDDRTIRESLVEHRRLVVNRYIAEARHLARELSQSLSEVDVSADVLERAARYRALLPHAAEQIPERYADMPYRALFTLMAARLSAVLADEPAAYTDATELRADLEVIAASLSAHRGARAGLFQVERMLWRVRTFGFHLATLDIRQDAAELRVAIAELSGIDDWAERSREERTAMLSEWLDAPPGAPAEPGPELTRALNVLRTIRRCRDVFGEDAVGSFIISMTQGADDVLSVMLLARVAGLAPQGEPLAMDIAPLLETVDDLRAGVPILEELAATQAYRRHLDGRAGRQLIMIGYSDSNKDSGIAAARWALQNTQRELTEAAQRLGLDLVFFHGRGGTVSRGGGNMVHGIHAAPEGSVNGYLRVTEQGEVIHQKYGIRPLALRNLELITGATLRASLQTAREIPPEWVDAMALVAAEARRTYRALVYEHPDFEAYFRQATPIDVIERLGIGSRPSARRTRQGIQNLRAIPWVFSWAQTRVGLPGTYGVGTGLAAAAESFGPDMLHAMLEWPFFATFVNDVEMVVAKSDLDIGRYYRQLAEPGLHGVYATIEKELRTTEARILELKRAGELLETDEMLRRALRLRNPYVDPLNVLQVKLLAEWRAGDRQDDALLATLFETVNGIARGIQNTG